MSFSDEEIISFLLGDADEDLTGRIRDRLACDEELAERVSHFRCVLNHLDSVAEHFEPPIDLIDKTLSRIDASTVSAAAADNSDDVSAECEFDRPIASCLAATVEQSKSDRGWLDSAALTLSLTVLCCLAIPAIIRVRYESRRVQCADNLRQTGKSLTEFALRRPDQRYPFVPSLGPAAFSGVFVVRLKEQDLLPAGRMLPCASLNGIDRPSFKANLIVPTLEELCLADDAERECLKAAIGGDYAYNLGVFEEGILVAPQNTGNSHFAILADAPLFKEDTDQVIAHDGKGLNILYDDGQVRFVNSRWLQSLDAADNPFRNMLGDHEAGISQVDASLAPSQFPPIIVAR